jgi:hypothetical protein
MTASDVLTASIREKLWHKMRKDLSNYIPETAQNKLLMCCACGRFLPQEAFDLEHLIPQQALKRDPDVVRVNPDTPRNVRSGNLLLCRKPLTLKGGGRVYDNGCNSWKGRFYDKPIRELVFGTALQSSGSFTDVHIIAALCLAYLAMVAEFGYIVVLMRSGSLMREQFFSPHKFHRNLPLRSQMLLGGPLPVSRPDARMWARPFSFSFERPGCCTIGARNFALLVPVSRDPREPIARHLPFAPNKYKLRPDFKTFFD